MRTAVAVSMALLLIWGCVQYQAAPEAPQPSELRGRTVVLPFVDVANILGYNASFRNPLTSKVSFTGQVDEDGASLMTNTLYRMIGQEKGLVWGRHTDRSLAPKNMDGGHKVNHLEQLQAIGRNENADTVLAGYLYAFRERIGGAYGVERPARVAFELVLIGVDTGRVVWQGAFKETQKPLSEDLAQLGTFIRRAGRWISARDMGANALKEMLKSIPPSGLP